MSQEQVVAFWRSARSNAALQGKLLALEKSPDVDQAVAAIVQLAAAEGFVFSIEDYKETVRQKLVDTFKVSGELDDEALGKVAGGVASEPRLRNAELPRLPMGAVGYGFGGS